MQFVAKPGESCSVSRLVPHMDTSTVRGHSTLPEARFPLLEDVYLCSYESLGPYRRASTGASLQVSVATMCGLKDIHGAYVCVTDNQTRNANRFLASLRLICTKELHATCVRSSKRVLKANLCDSRKPLCAVRLKRLSLNFSPTAYIVHLCICSSSRLPCHLPREQIIHALKEELKDLRHVTVGQLIHLRELSGIADHSSVSFRVSKVIGTCKVVDHDGLLDATCNAATRYVVHNKQHFDVITKEKESLFASGLHRLEHRSVNSRYERSVFVSRKREMMMSYFCNSRETHSVSFHELQLLKHFYPALTTLRYIMPTQLTMHATILMPKNIVIYGQSDVLQRSTRIEAGQFFVLPMEHHAVSDGLTIASREIQYSRFKKRLTGVFVEQFAFLGGPPSVHFVCTSGNNASTRLEYTGNEIPLMEKFIRLQVDALVRRIPKSHSSCINKIPIEVRRALYTYLVEPKKEQTKNPSWSQEKPPGISSNHAKAKMLGWNIVGGQDSVKEIILQTFRPVSRRQELCETYPITKRNVLLFGPPGTGKTLIAKVLSNELGLSFINVRGPELLSMYVGESERHIRSVFKRAAEMQPSLIFFDEVDSIAAAHHGSMASISGRLASQMMLELDNIKLAQDIYVLGASNRPDMIEKSLLRPGRFDFLIYVGMNFEQNRHGDILRACTQHMKLSSQVRLDEVAQFCHPHCSGADIYGICVRAWKLAVKRYLTNSVDLFTSREMSETVYVTKKDLIESAVATRPSISVSDMSKYEQLRNEYDARCLVNYIR